MALVSGEPLGDGLWQLPGGSVYGVEWVVDCADVAALEPIRSVYEIVRTPEDSAVATATALSGSAAYLGRVNPYPADYDFNEIVLVRASALNEAAAIFADRLQRNIERILRNSDIRFSELKIGGNVHTGKGFKWDLQEVRQGFKVLHAPDFEEGSLLSLTDATLHRQMIKTDFVAKVGDDWKELTKSYRFAYQPSASADANDIDLLAPENLSETIYQELFFSEAEARLAARISESSDKGGFHRPEVMKKYRDLMDVEIAHYGALGTADNISHLKLLKRWFNKLRMDRDHASIERLSWIFRSEINAAHEVTEMMRIVVLAIEKNLLSRDEMFYQLCRLEALMRQRDLQLPAAIDRNCRLGLEAAKKHMGKNELTVCAQRLAALSTEVEGWIEEQAKQHLRDQVLLPYAEALDINIGEDRDLHRSDLFRELDHGDRMHYLVTRYLREDSRVVKRRFDAGDKIIRFGEEARCCFVLLEGSVVATDPAHEQTPAHIREMGPLTLIGEIGLMHSGERRTAEVTAACHVEVLEIPRVVFRELMNDRSFRLFTSFLSTDRLMEDRARERRRKE